jgi:hypothetical protein
MKKKLFFLMLLFSLVTIQTVHADLIDELAKEKQQYCPDIPPSKIHGCEAVCPDDFSLKSPIDDKGFYTCVSNSNPNLVCTYQNKLCLYDREEILKKAVEEYKQSLNLANGTNIPYTKFLVELITLDPNVLEKVKDDTKYANIYVFSKGIQEALKVFAWFSLVVASVVGLATVLFKLGEGYREEVFRKNVSVTDFFISHGKAIMIKVFIATAFFAVPFLHKDSNGNTYFYPLAIDIYRKVLVAGDDLAEKVGEKFLDVYFEKSMGNLLDSVLTAKDYYEKKVRILETAQQQLQKLVNKCYQIYDTGGRRFADMTDDELENLPAKVDLSSGNYPSVYRCSGSEVELDLKTKELLKYKFVLRLVNNYILAILNDSNYWKYFYQKTYEKFKKYGWVVLPLTAYIVESELNNEVMEKLEANSEDLNNFKEFILGIASRKVTSPYVEAFAEAKPFSEEYKKKVDKYNREKEEAEPSLWAKVAVVLSLPPGNWIFSTIHNFTDSVVEKAFDNIPLIGGLLRKTFLALGATALTLGASIYASYNLTLYLLSIAPILALVIAGLGRLISVALYLAELIIVLPFKAIPLAVDRGWQEVFWSIFNRVLFISIIPASVVVASFFGMALYDLGEFLFTFLPSQMLSLSNELASMTKTIIFALIWFTGKLAITYFLFKLVWNAPNTIQEWLGGLVGTRLHRTGIEEEVEEQTRRITRF